MFAEHFRRGLSMKELQIIDFTKRTLRMSDGLGVENLNKLP